MKFLPEFSGAICAVIIPISLGNVLATIILAAVGAAIGFFVKYFLERCFPKK